MNFENIVNTLFNISVAFTTVQIYLQVNKIWKRKQELEVARSQSISGMLILGVSCIISMFYYAFNDDMTSLLESSFYLVQAIVFGLISTGIFVKGDEKISLWQSMLRAIRFERKEANYLIKKFFKPTNANIIIDILHQLAMIDDNLDPKEQELIEAFAKEWNIEYKIEELNSKRTSSAESNFIRLRYSLEHYLDSEPPKEQAAQLKDMMQTIIEADDEISTEEELISAELMGLVENYISDAKSEKFHVMIVPQNVTQHNSIKGLIPNAKRFDVAGGIAYSVGQFYSMRYAEMICKQFREEKLFTIVHNLDPNIRQLDDDVKPDDEVEEEE
jgi:hypothetical protein